ncbi:hypothetical protein AGMMS50212_08200 [Spirochaetia bacterium]|nr:hypothetical protein AGMMS50212_08200 [Spirochaetia bacterium]
MSTVTDFFNKAKNNKALQTDLDTAFTEAVINVAAKNGISLKQADFLNRRGDMSDKELSAVAGGAPNSSLAQLWLDLYEKQIPISDY